MKFFCIIASSYVKVIGQSDEIFLHYCIIGELWWWTDCEQLVSSFPELEEEGCAGQWTMDNGWRTVNVGKSHDKSIGQYMNLENPMIYQSVSTHWWFVGLDPRGLLLTHQYQFSYNGRRMIVWIMDNVQWLGNTQCWMFYNHISRYNWNKVSYKYNIYFLLKFKMMQQFRVISSSYIICNIVG